MVHVDDEEDGRPILSYLGEETMVLIALGEADRLDEVVELLIPLSGCLFDGGCSWPDATKPFGCSM